MAPCDLLCRRIWRFARSTTCRPGLRRCSPKGHRPSLRFAAWQLPHVEDIEFGHGHRFIIRVVFPLVLVKSAKGRSYNTSDLAGAMVGCLTTNKKAFAGEVIWRE